MRVIVIFYGIFCSIFSVHTRLHKRALKALHVCVLKWLFAACEQERALRVCTYSGSSSSDTETEPEGTGSTLGSPQKTLINRAKKNDSGMLGNCSRWMIYKAPSIVIMSFVEVGSSLTKSAFFFLNSFLRSQSSRTRTPWRGEVWKNPCQSWTAINTTCSRTWRRTAGRFRSTTCCTRSRPLMGKQETGSVWVFKCLIVPS